MVDRLGLGRICKSRSLVMPISGFDICYSWLIFPWIVRSISADGVQSDSAPLQTIGSANNRGFANTQCQWWGIAQFDWKLRRQPTSSTIPSIEPNTKSVGKLTPIRSQNSLDCAIDFFDFPEWINRSPRYDVGQVRFSISFGESGWNINEVHPWQTVSAFMIDSRSY